MANFYNPYFNPYINNQFAMQDLQNMRNDIDRQIRNLQQQQQQNQMPPQINQNFSLVPNNNSEFEGKFANDIEEVKNTFVTKIGLFINKSYNTLWIKSVDGSIKIYKLEEIVEQDDKDIEISKLKKELESLKNNIDLSSTPNDLKESKSNYKDNRSIKK